MDLRRREGPSRERRLNEACDVRKALDRFSQSSIESGRRYALGLSTRRMRPHRHAAAVAVAIGMLGIRSAASEGQDSQVVSPPPYDPRNDNGVAEAAPPPYDERFIKPPPPPPPPPRPDAGTKAEHKRRGTADAGTPAFNKSGGFKLDHGVAEAAPPPTDPEPFLPPPDKGFRIDHGVAEAPPPPVRSIEVLHLTTVPRVPISYQGQEVKQPFNWLMKPSSPVQIGDPKDPRAITVYLWPNYDRVEPPTLGLRSPRRLKVRFGDVEAFTPTQIVIHSGQPIHPLVFEDVETHARLVVRLGR